MGCVRWFMLLSAVFCLCACKQQKGSKACLQQADSYGLPHHGLSLVVETRREGLMSRLFEQPLSVTFYYADKQHRPDRIVYVQPDAGRCEWRVLYTDSSFVIAEGEKGRTEYVVHDGLVVCRRPLGSALPTCTYHYDITRHLQRMGDDYWIWQGAQLQEWQVRSHDNRNMVTRYVSYDDQKPLSQSVMAYIVAREWGKRWLLPFLLNGNFGELPPQTPFRVSYDDGHFELYPSTFDDKGRLSECRDVERRTVSTFYWR